MSEPSSFLGRGWAFPPAFASGGARMTEDEADIDASLRILFGTTPGERFLQPKYGLDMHELMFEPLSTTKSSHQGFSNPATRRGFHLHLPDCRLRPFAHDRYRSGLPQVFRAVC